MISEFVKRWEDRKHELRAAWKTAKPETYADIVKGVVGILAHQGWEESPDPDRITSIDHGDYQGTILFVVAAKGYQPSTFWAVAVSYGSCSGCDTLQAISDHIPYDHEGDTPESALDQYMTLALHVVQEFKVIE